MKILALQLCINFRISAMWLQFSSSNQCSRRSSILSPAEEKIEFTRLFCMAECFLYTQSSRICDLSIISYFSGLSITWYLNSGILLYEMLYGRTPFRGKNRRKTFANILHKDLTFPSGIPVKSCTLTSIVVKIMSSCSPLLVSITVFHCI